MTDAAAVRAAYERYLEAFVAGDRAGIDAVVAYPLAHIAETEVRMCDSFPIDPVDLRRRKGWHTTVNSRFEVVVVSPTKAHLVLHSGERVRADGSLIETVSAFYAFRLTADGWKLYAISDVVTPASERRQAVPLDDRR
ncbi:hypothetical protein [Asanoa sp. NPDC050611]|uniref:hypothetical protein n=1 Tax=Asanoa sp. NPDC050611 TaxID=3157098 RepID=UPI0033F9CBE0